MPAQPELDADAEAVESAKRMLRRAVLFRRDARSAVDRVRDDAARTERFIDACATELPDTVAAYLSAGTEPSTLQLLAWLAVRQVRVLLPVLTGPQGLSEPCWAAYAGPDALRVGRRGILEPTTDPEPPGILDHAGLIISPGLAANPAGDRLGRGGGWYDRALAARSTDAPVWLLLNDDEVLPAIPTRPWDRPVDAIVTPGASLRCPPDETPRTPWA